MSTTDLFEAGLRQAQRHVVEGLERLQKQRDLIERLERDGHERMLPEARRTLGEMERLQREMERHVVDQGRLLEAARKRDRI